MAETRYTDRTDGVEEKLRLLRQAYEAGRLDQALSLADSLKDTLRCERQWQGRGQGLAGAEGFGRVAELPAAWEAWARGWSFYKVLTLHEGAGLERGAELVGAELVFGEDQVSDLRRELRVARVEGGALREIASQVNGEVCVGGVRQCRVMFMARTPAKGQAEYLIFFGNPWAELPEYLTDLQVRGEGYELEIENRHYCAKLSGQTGQLERLTYRRAQGLELFAGGEGHGEPPHIDWAHDYWPMRSSRNSASPTGKPAPITR